MAWDGEGSSQRASEEFMDWLEARAEEIADRHFFTSLAGVSFPNDDGSDRQALLAACAEYDPLTLELEPGNPFHSQAVKVLRADGRQIGYLDRRCAQEITNKTVAGERFAAAFCERREAGHRPGEAHIHGAVIVIFHLNAKQRAERIAAEKAGT